MNVVAIIRLTILCILGRFVLRWRRLARAGFGIGVTNIPRLVRYDGGNASVWVLGQVFFFGSAILLLTLFRWYWALLAIFLAGGLERPLLVFLCGGDLEAALRFRREHEAEIDELKRLEGRDPLEDALD